VAAIKKQQKKPIPTRVSWKHLNTKNPLWVGLFFFLSISDMLGDLYRIFCFMFDGCKDKRSGPADYVKKNKKTKRK
jgi:hypothetical protein